MVSQRLDTFSCITITFKICLVPCNIKKFSTPLNAIVLVSTLTELCLVSLANLFARRNLEGVMYNYVIDTNLWRSNALNTIEEILCSK